MRRRRVEAGEQVTPVYPPPPLPARSAFRVRSIYRAPRRLRKSDDTGTSKPVRSEHRVQRKHAEEGAAVDDDRPLLRQRVRFAGRWGLVQLLRMFGPCRAPNPALMSSGWAAKLPIPGQGARSRAGAGCAGSGRRRCPRPGRAVGECRSECAWGQVLSRTGFSRRARAAATLMAVVVLPTPPSG